MTFIFIVLMMNEQLEKIFQKNPHWNRVYFILEKCQKAGHQTVLVGGAVRDVLLGLAPKDFDIASSASPDQLLELFPYAHPVGKSFGVIWIPFKDGAGVEIATFRKDGTYSDGRHPSSVEFCTLSQDAQRRDFTVNALYYDTQAHRVIDETKGLKDLKNKIIRAVGVANQRFKEDHLRILRAARFAVTFNFTIEEKTLSALKKWTPYLKKISKERILDELNKTFIHGKFKNTVDYFKQIHLLEVLFPSSDVDWYHHLLWNIPNSSSKPLNFWWSLLLAPVGLKNDDQLKSLLKNSLLCFPNQQYREIFEFFSFFSDMTKLKVREGQKIRWLSRAHNLWYLELAQHLVLFQDSSQKNLSDWKALQKKYESLLKRDKLPKPWVTGHDLIQKNIPKGPRFSELLEKLYDDQLEGLARSKEELLKKI